MNATHNPLDSLGPDVHVYALQRGLEKDTLKICFEITEESFIDIQRWNNRKKASSAKYGAKRAFPILRCHSHQHLQRSEKQPVPFLSVLFGQ